MHFLTLKSMDGKDMQSLIDNAIKIKKNPSKYSDSLKNKTLAMLFQKASTRTRCSFEAGMTQLGGHAIFLDWTTTQLHKASLKDEIRCISRYADIIMARVYKQEDLEIMAENSDVPVINALSDTAHPCQIMADLMTIKEKKGRLKGLKLAYIGDGNNVCNSLILGCTKAGMKISVACPVGYGPDKAVIKSVSSSGLFELTNDPKKAAKDADMIYTDTWISMGKESEKEKRLKIFKSYQVNKQLLGNAMFMHCLPASRGYEVTDEVLDSKNSIVFDQAENRLHAQKAIMLSLLNKI